MDLCLLFGFMNDLFEVLVIEVFSLDIAVGRYAPGSSCDNDFMGTLEVLRDLVEEGLTRSLDTDG